MAIKGIGIYAKADQGRASRLVQMFKNGGIDKAQVALAEVTFASQPKAKTTLKGNAGTVDRLRYIVHNSKIYKGTSRLTNFVANGDTVHVVWVGHAQYSSAPGSSIKFLPHYGTRRADEGVLMSAKELARTIFAVLGGAGHRVYPASLTIISCHSGLPRAESHRQMADFGAPGIRPGRFTTSRDNNPLGWRVLQHLHALYAPPPATTCDVAAPTVAFSGMEMGQIAVPPTGALWARAHL